MIKNRKMTQSTQSIVKVFYIGKNAKKIAEYVRNQLKEDMMTDQMTIKEYKDPFKGQ